VSQPRLRLQRLSRDHDLTGLQSGAEELDDWLHRHALAAQEMDTARTFLLTRGRRVVGSFSLTMGSVLREEAPARLLRGMPGYPVGMVLLARLAVDRRHQGQGLGALLLTEALRKALAAGEAAAARLVVVDAIDQRAAEFYRHHGFIAIPEHPFRLYHRLKDIHASLKTPTPPTPEPTSAQTSEDAHRLRHASDT
jgi:GNAT superfamily N-acetyltransferase